MNHTNNCCPGEEKNNKSIEVIQEITSTGKEINSVLTNMETSIKKISDIISNASGLMETRRPLLEIKNKKTVIKIFISLFLLFGLIVISDLYFFNRISEIEIRIENK